MPVLDAKALKTDPKGLSFLRDVLRSGSGSQAQKPAGKEATPRTRRRKAQDGELEAHAR